MLPVGLTIDNAILWGLKPGKYIAQVQKAAKKAFNKYIKSSLLIKTARLPDEDNQGVFIITNIEIINYQAIQREIGDQSSPRSALYDVKIRVNKSTALGEIDFADWQNRHDFQITITKQGETDKISDVSTEYKKVLDTLKILPKTLANGKHTPLDNIDTVTIASGGFGIVDWYRSTIQGKTVIQKTTIDEAYPFLQEEIFIDGIAKLAAEDQARDDQSKIIDNYFAATELSLNNQLNATKRAEKELSLE